MRAESIRFQDIFKINADSGRITLGSERYIMTDAGAWGNMRKELIDNLGWEIARGVLERVGFQSGTNDARELRNRYSWPTEEEWLKAGPRLHYLEGIVKVGVDRMDVSRDHGRFYMAGDWYDSYEAEQHLKHYGVGGRSVCWTLEGYATGYATEFFKRNIICVETRCRGKGDEVCGFELRPESEWEGRALPMKEMVAAVRFTERFDRCLRAISDMGCELEQSSLDAIITTDQRGIITSCSQGGSDLLGVPPGEAIGRPVSGFYSGGKDEARRIMDRLLSEGRIRNYYTEVITPAKNRIPVALSASAIRNNGGQIVGTLGVAHNLSELRRLEDELSVKNRFMANILQDSADAILTLDGQNNITSWNRGAEMIFGYKAAEILGKPLAVLVPRDLKESRELDRIDERLRTVDAVRSYQTERVTHDGRRIQVMFTRTAIRDHEGNFIGSSAVVKDVTSAMSLERQLADAEHLASLGELSAGLAHEIKNPLAGIKGAIEVIRDSLDPADSHWEILADVLHEVNRINKTVHDLLSYAKPKPPTYVPIDLIDISHRILAMAQKSSMDRKCTYRLDVQEPIPMFTGDEAQLEQVLLNLLMNAQNVTPPDGRIDVRLSHDSDKSELRWEVQDSGPGVPEELRKKIFQPFFTTRPEGTGLGLATCLKNVQYHGGTIELYSETGKGARFVVILPLSCRL